MNCEFHPAALLYALHHGDKGREVSCAVIVRFFHSRCRFSLSAEYLIISVDDVIDDCRISADHVRLIVWNRVIYIILAVYKETGIAVKHVWGDIFIDPLIVAAERKIESFQDFQP